MILITGNECQFYHSQDLIAEKVQLTPVSRSGRCFLLKRQPQMHLVIHKRNILLLIMLTLICNALDPDLADAMFFQQTKSFGAASPDLLGSFSSTQLPQFELRNFSHLLNLDVTLAANRSNKPLKVFQIF
jgi:hypothetical protein